MNGSNLLNLGGVVKKKITRTGNSACLVLGSDLLGFLGAAVGDYVDVEFMDGRLLIGSFGAEDVVPRKKAVARQRKTKPVDVDGMVEVVGLYQKHCVPAGMPNIRQNDGGLPSSTSLAILLKARWSQCQDIEWWDKYFQSVSKQSFFCGGNERGWRASLKWLCGRTKFEEWQDTLSNKELAEPKKKTRSLDYSYSTEDEWKNPSH